MLIAHQRIATDPETATRRDLPDLRATERKKRIMIKNIKPIASAAIAVAIAGGLAVSGISGTAEQTKGAGSADQAEQVQEVLAQYARSTDIRDGDTLAALFAETGRVVISAKDQNGEYQEVVDPIVGRDAIAYAVGHAQAPLPVLNSEQHIITAPITEIDGKKAHLNMQFITYTVHGSAEPAGGWPAGTAGAQGTVAPFESGYYDADLVKVGGEWQITELVILSQLPTVIPGA